MTEKKLKSAGGVVWFVFSFLFLGVGWLWGYLTAPFAVARSVGRTAGWRAYNRMARRALGATDSPEPKMPPPPRPPKGGPHGQG